MYSLPKNCKGKMQQHVDEGRVAGAAGWRAGRTLQQQGWLGQRGAARVRYLEEEVEAKEGATGVDREHGGVLDGHALRLLVVLREEGGREGVCGREDARGNTQEQPRGVIVGDGVVCVCVCVCVCVQGRQSGVNQGP